MKPHYFLPIVLLAHACASAEIHSGSIQGGAIGHEACALQLEFDITVIDASGQPVSGLDLWVRGVELYGETYRLGATDEGGHLVRTLCYLLTGQYARWDPSKDPVELSITWHKDLRYQQLSLSPPTDEVIAEGRQFDLPPGQPREGPLRSLPGTGERAYRLVLQIALSGAASGAA